MSAPVIDFVSPDDIAPFDVLTEDVDAPIASDPNALTCAECGKEFIHSGRGRKPKTCTDCRAAASTSKPRSAGRGSSKKIQNDVQTTLMGLGTMVMAVDKFDGAVIVSKSPDLAEVLAMMAERNPAFKKFLTQTSDGVVWLQLATVCASIAVPILAHHKLIGPADPEAHAEFERAMFTQFVGPIS